MTFKEGDIVKHKISDQKFVIIKVYPKRWYRNITYYLASNGLANKEMGFLIKDILYEGEIK